MSLSKIKKKTLFLWLNSCDFYALNASRKGVEVANVYRNTPRIFKALRRLQIKINLFSIYPWLDTWADQLELYDTVILHASKLTPPVVRYINNKKPGMRVIIWYWNPVIKTESIYKFPLEDCEVWTFDEEDSKEFSLNYNTQYYFKDLKLKGNRIVNDVVFVGGDKGRLDFLIEIKNKLESLALKTNFHIVNTSIVSASKFKYNKRISYVDILDKIDTSKAVLDVVSEGQTGLTIRPLEALYFSKKLITNDKSIMYRDFYRASNIFILGYDDLNSIVVFLNLPFEKLPDEVFEKYDFDQWFARFFNKRN